MTHKSYEGYGRPCLVSVKAKYETLPGSNHSIAIPRKGSYFGAATWFDGETRITTSCGLIFPDAYVRSLPNLDYQDYSYEKWSWREFEEVEDEVLLQHLENKEIPDWFRNLCKEIIKEIHYKE